MSRIDEAYSYQIIRAAALQRAAIATSRSAARADFSIAAFAQRSARLIGAVA